jgi:hyperosmotically inducible protein
MARNDARYRNDRNDHNYRDASVERDQAWRDRRADNDRNDHNGSAPDAWITASTKMKFATDPLVPATSINVDTDNGEVTLFGTVPSQASAQQAVRLAHQVNGVRMVHNELVVVPKDDRKQATQDDRRVTARIKDRFDKANFHQASIHVDVRAGVARLTGTYARDRDHYDALMLARTTPGVLYVQDDLESDDNRAGNE